jgi:hypothetical protein
LVDKKLKESLNIDQTDLEPILQAHAGTRVFAEALAEIEDRQELVRALANYIQFNSVFGSGVANLAGEIASRQDLFRDPDEEVVLVADRSVEVAAHIFFAAIDEFGDRDKGQRGNHRALAQATLKAVASFFNFSLATLNKTSEAGENTLAAIKEVRDGYGLNRALDEPKLFRAIGFHIGSEVLADEEFNILDGFLRTNYPELVEYLRKTSVSISGTANPAYCWIQIHTHVEANHFKAALTSANLALRFYAGDETQACIKAWMLDGFREFAIVQTEFMKRVVERSTCAFAN